MILGVDFAGRYRLIIVPADVTSNTSFLDSIVHQQVKAIIDTIIKNYNCSGLYDESVQGSSPWSPERRDAGAAMLVATETRVPTIGLRATIKRLVMPPALEVIA